MQKAAVLALAVLALLFFGLSPLAALYVDVLWFAEVGYSQVFWTMLTSRLALFSLAAAAFFVIPLLVLRLSFRSSKDAPKAIKGPYAVLALAVLALVAGSWASDSWATLLLFFNPVEFGAADPVFGADISFYFFELPFYSLIWSILFGAFLVSLIAAAVLRLLSMLTFAERVHTAEESVAIRPRIMKLKKKALSSLLPMAGILLILLGAGLFLHRYSVLYSSIGVVHGAGWVDLNIVLPLITGLSALSIISGIVFFVSARRQAKRLPVLAIAGLVGVAIIGFVAAFAAQAFVVAPDEFNRERPFLERNIEFTRTAYGLDRINEQPFPAHTDLTLDDIRRNSATMQNVRLWDWKPLLETYKQVQLIRTYYDFADTDVDRYTINGEYKQVIVSAREVNPRLIPEKTWVNERLVFTHGYGMTMTPVREVSPEGLPLLYVKDIPPQSPFFNLTKPEIYFGELVSDYVVTNTRTEELDYPLGEKNVYTTYQGEAGIPLSGLARFAMALRFGSPEILLSGSITPESKLLIRRNIIERARSIAPFLVFDRDPYIVLHEGRLYWILDAYTVSDKYPYSEKSRGINYIRNPVKAVIDAYNGRVDFYVIENEPLIRAYSRIFPGLFKPFEEMPEGLKAHVRYPLDMFSVQSSLLSVYHMRDSRVFYNKEDVWEIPQELFERQRIPVEPYYLIMQLPGEQTEEYILFQTFTPAAKNNIIGWLAGRSDAPHYGQLLLYRFPKEKLIFGPMQLEARIDQDAEIAQQFALWSQAGTRVIRGHVLIIPMNGGLLYIEPIYLRATDAALPELRRVVVMFGDRLTMQPTIEQALAVLFGKELEAPAPRIAPEEIKTLAELAKQALEHYRAGQAALQAGDWATYGRELELMRQILERMSE